VATDERLSQHDSQIGRLEQVMTALAEAQVRTEDELDRLAKAQATTEAHMKELRQAMIDLAKAQANTERQWQAYINTLPKN
jgi:regulator of protease activity HflC (stomatin/prohibitin superfamily)